MSNNGKTLFIKVENPDNYVRFAQKKYTLKQITFHTPSEHYLDGAPYDMEIQFHHQNKSLDFLNISVFVDAMSGTNKLLAKLWKDLPFSSNLEGSSIRFSPDELLPIKRRFYTYNGSMSIPPCTENTNWIVFQDPIKMSIRQLDQFRSVIKHNARPVQKRYGQKLKISKAY
jgi:carbonic anhydrase